VKVTPKVEMEATLPASDNMNGPSSDRGDPSGEELADGTIIILLMQNDGSGNLVCKETDNSTSFNALPAGTNIAV
jgi:hypothetical protein